MPETRIDEPELPSRQHDEAQTILREHLRRLGLKQSAQRETVLRAFCDSHEHMTTEQLHHRVQLLDPAIGYSTVYRSLKLFQECGLAAEIFFHDGVARYEHQLNRRGHYHMVCTNCGESVEFVAPGIEQVQQAVGRQYRYQTTRHNFQIYGLCEHCQAR